MKFKINDLVRIKPIEWYVANKDNNGYVDCGSILFTSSMALKCGEIARVTNIIGNRYVLDGDPDVVWSDDMLDYCVTEVDETLNAIVIGGRAYKALPKGSHSCSSCDLYVHCCDGCKLHGIGFCVQMFDDPTLYFRYSESLTGKLNELKSKKNEHKL